MVALLVSEFLASVIWGLVRRSSRNDSASWRHHTRHKKATKHFRSFWTLLLFFSFLKNVILKGVTSFQTMFSFWAVKVMRQCQALYKNFTYLQVFHKSVSNFLGQLIAPCHYLQTFCTFRNWNTYASEAIHIVNIHSPVIVSLQIVTSSLSDCLS